MGKPFLDHKNPVTSLAFSPDGQIIASGSLDWTVRLWSSGWKSWLQVACDRLRDHPVLKNPHNEEAMEAKKTCQKYVWNEQAGQTGEISMGDKIMVPTATNPDK